MKTPWLLGLVLAHPVSTFAAEPPSPAPTVVPASAVEKRPKPAWSVRVEVLMVEMPQDKALPLLPDLKDSSKSDAVAKHVLSLVEKKEATLVGYPIVQTLDGQRCVIETIEEKRYPVSYGDDPVPTDRKLGDAALASRTGERSALPSSFETRNTGVTLEVEPRVVGNGSWIEVNLVPQRVALASNESYVATMPDGSSVKLEQPQFVTNKTTTNIFVRSGQMELLSMHKLPKADGMIELHLIRATATALPNY